MPGKGLEFACENPKKKTIEPDTPEQVLKALSSLETTEEKLAALCKKYTDLLEEHRQLQARFKQNQKSLTTLVKEKEQLQSDHSKAVLAKSKLESLCRELQRHNKLIKEESLGRAKEEEEKRKEVTNKFQTTINDIQSQMNDHYSKNTKLREENVELANKLKSLIEQYEQREQHIEKILHHKDLEKQLVEAKMAQSTLLMTEEKEKGLREREHLIREATEAHKRILVMEAGEKQLREQVTLYTEKYEDFQSTLTKSNDVFQSFKTEMDKMTKKIKKLEKETSMWRGRWENSNKALLEMAEDKTRATKESIVQQTKIRKLESLCRVMQEERRQVSAAASASTAATPAADTSTSQTASSEDSAQDSTSAAAAAAAAAEEAPSNGDTAGDSTAAAATGETAPDRTATEQTDTQDTETTPIKNGSPEKTILPTNTPPNTPDEGHISRASPVTVETQQGENSQSEPTIEESGESQSEMATQANDSQSETASQENDSQSEVAKPESLLQSEVSKQETASSEQKEQVDKLEEKTEEQSIGDACPN